MNFEKINLQISKSKLNINLLLYKTVKDLIQTKLSDNQIIILIEKLKLLINSEEKFSKKLDILFNSVEYLSKNKAIQTKIINLFENTILEKKHLIVFKLSLNLIRFKDFILKESKLYTENFRIAEGVHIMDFTYDYNMLILPYSVRVSGSLLIKVLFRKINSKTNEIFKPIQSDIKKIKEIDPETILQIIFAESASQSIRSSSGSSYEKRFEEVLINNNIKYTGQSHDSNLQSVEYDFKLFFKNKSIGVSAKRTLRERYKQNHENVSQLDVDAMFLITLGIDLNEDKVNSILQKNKQYIFVASDLYYKKEYFKNNKRVFPLDKLNNSLIKSILSK